MELSVDKSQKQANIITSISFLVNELDLEYCKVLSKRLIEQAGKQESMTVLNPSYPQESNNILRHQGVALKLLVDYVEELKKVDSCKKKLSYDNSKRDEINRLFV